MSGTDNLITAAIIAGLIGAWYLGRYLLGTLDVWHHDRTHHPDE